MARTLEAWSRRLKPAMAGRHGVLPRLWLVSDSVRLPDPLAAAARLPAGAGVLARGLAPAVLARLVAVARRRRLVLLVGGDPAAALRWRCGLHLADRPPPAATRRVLLARRGGAPWALLSAAVHGRQGLARARRLGVDCAFVSPAFATASHPGAPGLGPCRWGRLASRLRCPAMALGGVGPVTAGRLPRALVQGLAAIQALR